MLDLLLRRARPLATEGLVDVAIADGRVVDLGPRIQHVAAREIDLDGALLTRGLEDKHVHLDKAFLWDHPAVHGATRAAASAAMRELNQHATTAEILGRMRRGVDLAVSHGTTTLHAQIEIDELVGLRGLEAALQLRQEYAGAVDLRLVAFPQEGLLSRAGVPDLFRQAAGMDLSAIGGAPGFDAGHEGHLEFVFDLAAQHNLDVDLHVDLSTSPERPVHEWELFEAARLIRSHGYQGRVTVAHLQALSRMPDQRILLDLLREHGIAVVTVPGAELHLARTWRDPPATDPRSVLTDVEALLEFGIPVSLATGHIRDPLNPYGDANLLRDLFLLCAALTLGEPTFAGRSALELILPRPPIIQPGQPADLVAFPVPDAARAIRHHPRPDLCLKAGRVTNA